MRFVQPLARRGVALLARTAVEPWQVVVAHSVLGLVAALLIAGSSHGGWLLAAVLLQLKTVLDNVDGGLARATGRVTELGRYLDTGLDLIVNVALFAALAQHGPALLAAVALVVLTFTLSCDFNAERLYRSARSDETPPATVSGPSRPSEEVRDPGIALLLFRGLYRLVLAPQDAAIARLDARLFAAASGRPFAAATRSERQAWNDLFSTAALVNLGLSSQYVLLGICLLLGAPFAYVYLVMLEGVYVVVVQVIRLRSYRRGTAAQAVRSGEQR